MNANEFVVSFLTLGLVGLPATASVIADQDLNQPCNTLSYKVNEDGTCTDLTHPTPRNFKRTNQPLRYHWKEKSKLSDDSNQNSDQELLIQILKQKENSNLDKIQLPYEQNKEEKSFNLFHYYLSPVQETVSDTTSLTKEKLSTFQAMVLENQYIQKGLSFVSEQYSKRRELILGSLVVLGTAKIIVQSKR